MVLKPDFQNTLQYFVYSNLPILMNPFNAINIVVTNTIIPTIPTTPISTTPTVDTSIAPTTNTSTASIPPVVFITPEVLQALQSYTLNNFPDIGLPKDIQGVAKNFFANIPPLSLITPTTAVPVTTTTTTTTTIATVVPTIA